MGLTRAQKDNIYFELYRHKKNRDVAYRFKVWPPADGKRVMCVAYNINIFRLTGEQPIPIGPCEIYFSSVNDYKEFDWRRYR